jgi:hypothetical protein
MAPSKHPGGQATGAASAVTGDPTSSAAGLMARGPMAGTICAKAMCHR